MAAEISTFADFWSFYVGQHRRQGTRVLHFAGTSAGLLCFARAFASGDGAFFLWGLIASYALAWIGHFAIEKNRPATFEHPWWSLLGDLKMYGLMWRGEMTAQVTRLGLAQPAAVRQ